MNKFLVSLLCLCCLSMTACDPSPYGFNYEELRADVIRVELIDYEMPGAKHINTFFGNQERRLLPFDSDRVTVLETLDAENAEGFFRQLCDISLLYKYWGHYNSPKGVCIRMVYSNGDFVILTADYENNSFQGYIGRYQENGSVLSFIGTFQGLSEFTNLVKDNFKKQLVFD